MKIGDKDITLNGKPFIIAEVSQNHDGSLGQAHAFIDAVAETGVDAIKFQTHYAEEESTIKEPFRVKFSYEDQTRYDYWKRMEFTSDQWRGLFEHAKERNLIFLSSPFSKKALDVLNSIGVLAWKFGAGEVFNYSLLKSAIKTGKPIILSTGLSTYEDIDEQIALADINKVAILQCVTAYPSKAEQINIGLIPELKNRYCVPVGISDHSSTIYPSLAAVTLGASIVEVHVTLSKYMFGPDIKASVDIEQLKEIVKGADFIYKMRNSNVSLAERSSEQQELKKTFSKSIYYRKNLSAGTIISNEMLIEKKPNIGVEALYLQDFVGRKLSRDVEKDDLLSKNDFV